MYADGLAEPVVDTAEPGVNITLKCGVDKSKINAYVYAVTWYRQEPDGRIQIVTSLSSLYLKEDPLTVPSVELYTPGLFEGNTDWTELVPVLCLVRDTSPGRHRVNWTIGAEAAAPGSSEEGEIEPDGSYRETRLRGGTESSGLSAPRQLSRAARRRERSNPTGPIACAATSQSARINGTAAL
ncbi:UNVERIFIED_CONTAM: hypothetical protein FKN15_034412 [Acipenser sinensis]